MRIGIDLDNTLADYTPALARLCEAYGVAPAGRNAKLALRNHLRTIGRESEWTRLQGELYGPLMSEACLFEGAAEFLGAAQKRAFPCVIVSHRTQRPIAGQMYDLHASAREWLAHAGLGHLVAHFEETKSAKVSRIAALQPDVFIDDLPEILADGQFPPAVRGLLFDPGGEHLVVRGQGTTRVGSWREVASLLLE